MSPIASEARAFPSAEFGAEFSEERKILRGGGGHATGDNSFIRHDAYFFKDGNVTFLVDGTLYCVHRFFFSRDSVYFSTRFARLGVCDHEALPTIISIGDVERNDFEALLSILYPANFEVHELTYKQWKSILHLSTRWGFTSLRKLALNSIRPPTSHDRFVLARTYSVDHWVLPALIALCERTLPLSLDEARQMSLEDVVLVARVREEIRGGAVRVDAVDIPRYVAKVQQANLEAKADPKARAEAEANAKEAEENVKLETEAKAKLKTEAKAKREAEFKAKREAKAKVEAGAKEKREVDAKVNAEAEARERPEAEAREKREAEFKAKAEADGAPAQHSSTTSSTSHGFASTHPTTSITAAPSSASVVSSHTFVSHERKPDNDEQDGERFRRTLLDRLLGKTRDGKGNQVTVGLPAGVAAGVPDEAKSGAAVATADTQAPSNATATSNANEVAGGATAPDSPGDKSTDFSTQVRITTPEEVVVDSKPNQDPVPTSTSTRASADATLAPPVPEKDPAPEKDATVTKERAPTAEPAASAPAKPNGEPEASDAPDADAKKASEAPTQTGSPLATQGSGERPDEAAVEPVLQPSQNSEAGGEKPTTKGDDDKPKGLAKPALHPDPFHKVSTASTMSASGLRPPAPLSSLEQEDDGRASGARLTRAQKKRLRERARKQAQIGEKSDLHPLPGTTSNNVDDSVVQNPKPVATVPVDIPDWGRGVLVDVKTESSEDDAPVIVEKPDVAVTSTPTEMVFDDSTDDAEWGC